MKKIIFYGLLSVLTGCVTVNEEMLRKVNIVPPQKQQTTIEVKTGELIQKLNGEGQNRGVLSGTTVLNALGKSMMIRWNNKDIISDYGFSGELKKEPDYTITLSGVRNEDGSIAGAVFSGLTMALIPTSSTLTYDLNLDFVNNHTKQHYTVKPKNAVTTWIQILLLPALPFSWMGSNNMINDIADYSYDELRKQGAFDDAVTDIKVPLPKYSQAMEAVNPSTPSTKSIQENTRPELPQEAQFKPTGKLAYEAEAKAMSLGCTGINESRPASTLISTKEDMEYNLERYKVSCKQGEMLIQCNADECVQEY